MDALVLSMVVAEWSAAGRGPWELTVDLIAGTVVDAVDALVSGLWLDDGGAGLLALVPDVDVGSMVNATDLAVSSGLGLSGLGTWSLVKLGLAGAGLAARDGDDSVAGLGSARGGLAAVLPLYLPLGFFSLVLFSMTMVTSTSPEVCGESAKERHAKIQHAE